MTTLALSSFLPFRRSLTQRRSRAFGLLEVILVFAIVIGAAAVTFTIFDSSSASANAAALTDEMTLVTANLRASPYGLAHDYTNLTSDSAVKAGVFPKSMVVNGVPMTPYGPISVSESYVTPQQFDININYVPDSGAQCTKLMSALGAAGFDQILMAGSGPEDSGGPVTDAHGKLMMDQVTYWCSGAHVGDGSTVGMDLIGH